MKFIVLSVGLLSVIMLTSAARILLLSPFTSRSHMISLMPIAEILAERGHEMTVVSPYQHNLPNIHEIVMENVLEEMKEEFNMFKQRENTGILAAVSIFSKFATMSTMFLDKTLNNTEFHDYLTKKEVDLVILDAIFSEYCLPIIEDLNVPYIYYSTTFGLSWTLESMDVPLQLASVPSGFDFTTNEMTFLQRVTNTLATWSAIYARRLLFLAAIDEHAKKYYPNARPIAEFEREARLCFINSHPTTFWPRPLPPTVIPIPALHVRPARPLPEKFQQFADSCQEHGFILFSLGSIIESSTMPKHFLQVFVQVFSEIPQCVIWKWEEDQLPGISSNVFLVKWLPQQDLLGHRNVRLFITHGGLLGFQEAIYHAVPMLTFPVGSDQKTNSAKAVKEGMAILQDWDTFNEESLRESISLLINNPSYQANASRLSKLLRDEMVPSAEVAAYWVEHVLRHGGVDHLKTSSKDMPFYQVYLLDVFAFLASVIITLCLIVYFTLRLIWKCFKRGNVKQMKKKIQ